MNIIFHQTWILTKKKSKSTLLNFFVLSFSFFRKIILLKCWFTSPPIKNFSRNILYNLIHQNYTHKKLLLGHQATGNLQFDNKK